MICTKPMNEGTRKWSITYVGVVPAIILAFIVLTAFMMAKGRTIYIDSGETYIWSLSSSILRGDLTILSSSALVSVFYYSKVPLRKLTYPAILSGRYWLDPGDHVMYSRYLEIGSVITVNLNSVQGVNFFLFKGSDNFAQFVAGNQADYLIMKLSMNNVKQRLTFTIKSTDVYFMVFDNVYDEFYSHLDFTLSINSIEYSASNGIAYEEIFPINCPECLTEVVPLGTKNIFILPETFSSSGYLVFQSTSQEPLINATTTGSINQNWSPIKHGNARMKAGAVITIKRNQEGVEGLWIFLFFAICCCYFLALYCYSSIAKRSDSAEEDTIGSPSNAAADNCVHMTHQLEESARKRLLKKGLNTYQALPEIKLSDEDIESPVEGGCKEDSGRGIKSSWGGNEGWISHSKESCELPLCAAMSTETQLSVSQYGSDGVIDAGYPQRPWDEEAGLGLCESTPMLALDVDVSPMTPNTKITPVKKSFHSARSAPYRGSYIKSLNSAEKHKHTQERPLEGTGPHSVAYLKEFYNYFASKSLKSGIKPHSRTPLKNRRQSQYHDDGNNDWRGRRVSAGNSETDDKLEEYSVTSNERRKMSAYKEDHSRRGRIVSASALKSVRNEPSAAPLSSDSHPDHDEIVKELAGVGFDAEEEEEEEGNEDGSVYSTCDSDNSLHQSSSITLKRLSSKQSKSAEVKTKDGDNNNNDIIISRSKSRSKSKSISGERLDESDADIEDVRTKLFEEEEHLI